MTSARDAVPTLEQLVDLAAQLQRDRDRPDAELRLRDRGIGRSTSGGRRLRVIAWLGRVGTDAERPGATVRTSRRWMATALVAIGFTLGVGTARLIYFYDGSKPVNIIEVLAVFVGVQLGLLTLTAIAMLPAVLRGRLPLVAGMQDALGALSPGRWQAGLARILPQAQREALAFVLGRGRVYQQLFGSVQKWVVLVGSQSFGMAFHVGALAACLALVSFTDLAFGWSTTLEVQPERLHRVTDLLSAPWAAVAPDARPSIELIEATRYFRLGRGSLPGVESIEAVDPASLGGWWPFCAASMIVYGLLPRVVLWWIARRRLAAEVVRAFDRLPGFADLCDRLEQPLVQTAAAAPEAPAPDSASAGGQHPDPELATRPCTVVNWSGLALDDAALTSLIERLLGAQVTRVAGAGGSRTWQQDRELIGEIAAAQAVAIAVRAWEPPVLEFIDFTTELRGALADTVPIVVVPLALDAHGASARPTDADLAQWRRRIDAAGDPWLSVRSPAGST